MKIESLSVQDKKVIGDYFTQFTSLVKNQDNFLTELERSLSEMSSKRKTKRTGCLSCILKDLKTIGWGNNELNIFERTPSYRPHLSLPYIYYQNNVALGPSDAQSTWGRWDSVTHPYRNFFASESEWLQAAQEINNYWKIYYRTMNSGSRSLCSLVTMGTLCRGGKSSIKQGIKNAKASLEMKIGTKLMSLMQRI